MEQGLLVHGQSWYDSATIAELDPEIVVVKQHLRRLITARNCRASSLLRLPVELLDHVFDEIYHTHMDVQDIDRNSLHDLPEALSLICHQLVPLAQRRLFAADTFRFCTEGHRIRMLDMERCNSMLSGLIYKLILQWTPALSTITPQQDQPSPKGRDLLSLMYYPEAEELFHKFTGVRELTLPFMRVVSLISQPYRACSREGLVYPHYTSFS